MAVAMLASQAFADWHAYWWCAGAAALLALACVALLAPPSAAGASLSWRGLQDTIDTLGTAGPVLLSLTFMLYSLMFFALFSFLPVLLMERLGLSLAQAGCTAPSPPSPTLSATWGRACCWRAAGGVRR